MKISFQWLREFVDIPDEPSTLGEKMTMSGLAVDAIEPCGDDAVFDLDITANRGDCLSHLGVARELAAIYDVDLRPPPTTVSETAERADTAAAISIADADLCRRYCGRYIAGLRVAPSPDWLVRRLEAVGIRPINNVADATNYVLMELGHPLHAFDADTLVGGRILVRRAAAGETLQTLDGETRPLDPSMLVIADGRRPVALAGIMGGAETEISPSTRNVLLESAWFDPLSVRRTAREVNMSTEASYRFERGADIEMARTASDRAARLIQELAGGRVYAGVIDAYPGRRPRPTVHLRRARIRQHLGMEVPDARVERIFVRLGFDPVRGPAGWTITVPSHRHDLACEEDLLEEIARHHGYANFPSTLPAWSGQGRRLPGQEEEEFLRDRLSALGYSETCTIAFSNEDIERRFAPALDPVRLRNPLSEDAPVMRTSLVPSILRSVQWNLNRGNRDLSIYEIGKVYPVQGEYRRLALATTGARRAQSVHHSREDAGFYSLKGDLEALLGRFAVPLEAASTDLPEYLHPGRSVRLGTVALIGELHADYEELFKLRQKVYLAEIAIEDLLRAGLENIRAVPIPKYPAVRRDLSLLVDRRIRYADIVAAIRAAHIDELVRVEPFDKLERGPFPESCYGLAISLVYQSPDRTLTDAEVQDYDGRVLERLESIGARLRS